MNISKDLLEPLLVLSHLSVGVLGVDDGSVDKLSRIGVEELGGGLEVLVGSGPWSPGSDSEEVKSQSGWGGRVDRHSHDQSLTSVSIVVDIISPVVNVSWGPVDSSGPGGSRNKLTSVGVEELKEPSSSSSDSSVHLDGKGSNEFGVLLVGGSVEVHNSNVSEVGWVGLGIERNVRVGVSFSSVLVGITKGRESSSWESGGSSDGVDAQRNVSVRWDQKRIDLSSDVSA